MTKAILVMDMPERCLDCLECDSMKWELGMWYYCIPKAKEIIDANKIPSWCPLIKPPLKIPKRIKDENDRVYWLNYAYGWNACIDAIEGRKE